ncbi:MAG: hypothetical protein LC674_02780 [Actinobacteria bacterium]|nr:hypothetical protein [Actinomycetota bacterium]
MITQKVRNRMRSRSGKGASLSVLRGKARAAATEITPRTHPGPADYYTLPYRPGRVVMA